MNKCTMGRIEIFHYRLFSNSSDESNSEEVPEDELNFDIYKILKDNDNKKICLFKIYVQCQSINQ